MKPRTPRQIAEPAFRGYREIRSEDGGPGYYFDEEDSLRDDLSPSDFDFTGLGYEIAVAAESAADQEPEDQDSAFHKGLEGHLRDEFDALFKYL